MVELKKDSLMQRQSGDVKVGFTIQHADMPDYLFSAPMGKRFYVVFVDADDYDERELTANTYEVGLAEVITERTEGDKLRTRAVMLCKDSNFWLYVRAEHGNEEKDCREHICNYCAISSRSELATNIGAQMQFGILLEQYKIWQLDQQYSENLGRM